MSLTVNIYYTGTNGAARAFVKEMTDSGIADEIRKREGNLKYEYFLPVNDEQTVLLIDKWRDQAALDAHHKSDAMQKISRLREKYKLKMKVERYIDEPRDQE